MNLHVDNMLKDLEKDDFQAYLLTQFTNVEYVSGYRPTSFAFCIIKENPIVYASGMDMELAKNTSSIEVKEYESYDVMIKELKEEGIKCLAIEPALPFSTYVRFRDDFEIDAKTYIDKQRMIKAPEEIKKIARATEIAQKSFLQLDILNNSGTEKEVAFDLVRNMIENGASKESFDTIVASGPSSSFTMVYSERQQEIWDIVAEAHDKAIKAVKPGMKCCEVDKVARDIISDYGYGDKFIHSTGHSLGLDIHETPGFSLRDETIIEEGMVITVEPGIYLEGEFGVRLEDTISISKKANIIGNLPLSIE